MLGIRFEPRYDALFLNVARLETSPANVPTVVLLGSSKTRCAIEFDTAMSARLEAMGIKARFVRVTEGHATLGDFHQVLEAIQRSRPAALLIERELVTLEPNAYRLPEASQYPGWRERVRHGLTALVRPGMIARRRSENWNGSSFECGYPTDLATAKKRRATLKDRRASGPAERSAFLEAARRLKQQGIRVALLDLPSREDEIGEKPPSFVRAEQGAMLAVMRAGVVERVGDPPSLGPDDFQDEAHLNAGGQAATSA